MLEDQDRARTMRESARRWPHDNDASEATNSARAVRRLTFRQGVEWAIGDALGYIDQTIYANEDSDCIWTNAEMLEMLRDIRDLLAVPNRTDGSAER